MNMRGERLAGIRRSRVVSAVRGLRCCVAAIIGLMLATHSVLSAERLAIPDQAAQKTALATVKEVYKTELASAKSRGNMRCWRKLRSHAVS